MKLIIEFSLEDFINQCIFNINRINTTIFDDLYHSIIHFINPDNDLNKILTKITHKYKTNYDDLPLSLDEYIENEGITFENLIMEIYYPKESISDIDDIILPDFLQYGKPPQYGMYFGPINIKHMNLKTFKKTIIRINSLVIDKSVLSIIHQKIDINKNILLPSKLGAYEWRQTFYNKITGETFFCECFREALSKKDENDQIPVRRHLINALKTPSFKEGICHLCSDQNSDLEFCHLMYGSIFKIKYGAYIEKIKREKNINITDAENIVREIKGFAKIGENWINETLLFKYVVLLFPSYTVLREASPEWLGKQRLDIFLPELNLAIEYQGEQHFKEIKLFGGAEGLKKTVERDKLKALLCKKNNVDLIYFTFKEKLSENFVLERLIKYCKVNEIEI